MELTKLLSAAYFAGGILAMVLVITFLFEKIKRINFISTLVLFLLGWWSFGYYFWLRSNHYDYTDYSASVFNLGFLLIPITYYLWISTLFNKPRKSIIFAGYLTSIIFILFYAYSLYADNLDIFNPLSASGLIFSLYLAFIYVGFYILGIAELIGVVISNRNHEERAINKNILLLFILVMILGVLNVPALYGVKYFLYSGIVAIPLNIFLLAYVTVRDRLINMKVFYAQLLMGLMLSVNIMELFFSDSLSGAAYRLMMLIFLALISSLLIKNYRHDISQKERLQKLGKKLKNSNKKLKELDDAKNEFISIAAHQLRTPPTVIKGYLAMAKEDPNNLLDAETKDSISRAFASNERLIELVEDILNISRIESGKMQYDFKPNQSCKKIIEELKSNFEIKAKDKGLELRTEISKDEIPNITMDAKKIREVISNLIDNSIKYTFKGWINVKLFATDYGMIRIEVSDTGMGISESEMRNLFKKFSRGSNADQLSSGGIGLGIYVGRKIVNAHGGRIWAESPGTRKGSTFVVELPIR